MPRCVGGHPRRRRGWSHAAEPHIDTAEAERHIDAAAAEPHIDTAPRPFGALRNHSGLPPTSPDRPLPAPPPYARGRGIRRRESGPSRRRIGNARLALRHMSGIAVRSLAHPT
ncbi:hypothetical protein [Streptomyces malaysiensis]|uniref:hypothetical protein n=1 Tax=Streptomyces malaysiensis TaxID=92644 RepID=UPI00114CA469|nr:hypothetical protein [Streptomyces sp. SPMA113]